MTKKGIVLSAILAILLLTIIIIVSTQKNTINKNQTNENQTKNEGTNLSIKTETEINLSELKSKNLPIIIQVVKSEDEHCINMQKHIEELSEEMKGKAIIKCIDLEKGSEFFKTNNISIKSVPTQILYNSDGTPYVPTESEALGYKAVKDSNRKSYLYYS